VIVALEAAIGESGTLVMPTHSTELSNPAHWQNPPVPREWWETIRQNMPAFDVHLTTTRSMGLIPETFRKQAGTLRSQHPKLSFAARGPHAEFITAKHALTPSLGEQSPLARLYDLDGWVLLLGVGHGNNTSLHLAEARAKLPRRSAVREGSPMLVNGVRQWVEYEDVDWDEGDFERLGEDLARETKIETVGRVAGAIARLMPQRALVDFGIQWLELNRR
jgi:aminoglycoside 3-N-acetyltransferase